MSKHRYNIKNKLENSELAKYFHQSHNTNGKLEVTILQNNIKTAAAQRSHEEKWISRLKNLAPHGLNTETGDMLKRRIISTNSVSNVVISFDIILT